MLTRRYYELSQQHHPDKFVMSETDEQNDSESNISQVNEGYKVLKNDQLRIRHILEIYNAAPVEGQDKMPQEFLMEMMDLNEAIMSYRMEGNESMKALAEEKIASFEAEILAQLEEAVKDFDQETPQPDQLQIVKDCYLKTKYLRRLKDNLDSREVEL